MSHSMGGKFDLGSIASSTHGILFFGVPQQAGGFSNLLAATTDEGGGPAETEQMNTLKRDLRWLQESNTAYAQICTNFTTRYFLEAAGGHGQVSLPGLATVLGG